MGPDIYLLVDDERTIKGFDVIVRTADVAKDILKDMFPNIACVCFDHDLGEGENGYQLLNWSINHKVLPYKVQLVTSNPVGLSNMQRALLAEGYTAIHAREYVKQPKSVDIETPSDINPIFCGCQRCTFNYQTYKK